MYIEFYEELFSRKQRDIRVSQCRSDFISSKASSEGTCEPAHSDSNYSKSNLASFSETGGSELAYKRKKRIRSERATSSRPYLATSLANIAVHRRVIIADSNNCSQELGSSLSSTCRDKSELGKPASYHIRICVHRACTIVRTRVRAVKSKTV